MRTYLFVVKLIFENTCYIHLNTTYIGGNGKHLEMKYYLKNVIK